MLYSEVMKRIYIIIPAWKEESKECLMIEHTDGKTGHQTPNVELIFAEKDEYEIICDMVRLINEEQKLYHPQNHLPI